MDENEDHEPGVANSSDFTITLATAVTTAVTESGSQKLVEGGEIGEHRLGGSEREDCSACEGGDVMVEVLGSDVRFDVVSRENGEAICEGDDCGKRENLGDVNAEAVNEGNESTPTHQGVSGSDIYLDGNDVLRECESHDVDKETVLNTIVETDLEAKAVDVGVMTNELHEASVFQNVEVRSNTEIENGVSQADDKRDSTDEVMEECEDNSVRIVSCASLMSELRTKEGIFDEEGDEQCEVAANPAAGLIDSPKQDESEESDGLDQPPIQDESSFQVLDQGIGTPDTSPLDTSVMEGDEMEEDADICERAESPEQLEDEDPVYGSSGHQSNDGNVECEDRCVPGQNHVLEQSFFEDVDLDNKHTPETSLVDDTAMIVDDPTGSDLVDGDEEEEEEEEEGEEEEPEEDDEPVSDMNVKRGYPKSGNVVKDQRVSYQVPLENESEFSVFDLVWGKVKSHPWWPGQIFYPSDSSEKARKYFKKDCYLVAYFGDRSFAWNEGSVLKPFFKHFSQEEKQSNSESFQNAVTCALEEVSRRVELGLACSCISEEVYEKIKYQIVENAGIHEESSKREGVDWSTGVDFFEPDKLIKYVRALAVSPNSGANRLDLVIARAQLLAFNRLKGCDALADFQYYVGLMECDADSSLPADGSEMELVDSVAVGDSKTRSKGPHRRKHNLKDIVYQRRERKTLTDSMGDTIYYFDGDFDSPEDDNMLSSPTPGKKIKASPYIADDFTGKQSTKTISVAKVSNSAQQSFKVGECIRRVASQLTGSSSIMKVANDEDDSKSLADDAQEVSDHADEVADCADDSVTEEVPVPKKEASSNEMLSQLHLSARDPMKGYSFLTDIVSFFSEFRNLAVSIQRQRMRKAPGRKPKSSIHATGTSGTFEFDDRNDSYWPDMVVQNNAEVKPRRRGRKRKEDQLSGEREKPLKSNPRKYSRKKYKHGNREAAAETPSGNEEQHDQLPTGRRKYSRKKHLDGNYEAAADTPSGDEKQRDQLPTGPMDLVLNFSEAASIPSEVNLNKMFRRFGPLKESETEINLQSSCAKVVFKKRSDAEVAYSSATMFNIFGSAHVNYQLTYTPPVPSETTPLALTDGQEDAT